MVKSSTSYTITKPKPGNNSDCLSSLPPLPQTSTLSSRFPPCYLSYPALHPVSRFTPWIFTLLDPSSFAPFPDCGQSVPSNAAVWLYYSCVWNFSAFFLLPLGFSPRASIQGPQGSGSCWVLQPCLSEWFLSRPHFSITPPLPKHIH